MVTSGELMFAARYFGPPDRKKKDQLGRSRVNCGLVVALVAGAGYAVSRLTVVNGESANVLFYSNTKKDPVVKEKEALRFWGNPSDEMRFFELEEASLGGRTPKCPRVFIYDLAPELTDWRPSTATVNRSHQEVITVPSVAVDENANLMEVIMTRLANSKRCLATDPTEADLFLVPLLPKAKHWSDWIQLCSSPVLQGRRFDRELPHLTSENARRHVFVYPRVGYQPRCTGWWTTPMPAILASFARVAVGGYEEFLGDFQRGKTLKTTPKVHKNPELLVPRLVSAPYVANVRFSTTTIPKENDDITRSFLFHYSGTAHGSEKSIHLRTALQAACDTNPSKCGTAQTPDRRQAREAFEIPLEKRLTATLEMRNATFCLQPPGLTPGRSSIMTALLLGCIPVLFAKEQDRLWPLHLGPWLNDARVFISADKVLQDSYHVVKALTAISPDRIHHMRTAIRRHARRLQYALDDMPDDALEVLLRGLRAAAVSDPVVKKKHGS